MPTWEINTFLLWFLFNQFFQSSSHTFSHKFSRSFSHHVCWPQEIPTFLIQMFGGHKKYQFKSSYIFLSSQFKCLVDRGFLGWQGQRESLTGRLFRPKTVEALPTQLPIQCFVFGAGKSLFYFTFGDSDPFFLLVFFFSLVSEQSSFSVFMFFFGFFWGFFSAWFLGFVFFLSEVSFLFLRILFCLVSGSPLMDEQLRTRLSLISFGTFCICIHGFPQKKTYHSAIS